MAASELSDSEDPPSTQSNPTLTKKRRLGLLTCFAIVFVTQVLGALMATPVLRLFEMSACRDYYLKHEPSKIGNDGSVPEALCKGAEVQKEVAFINSMLYFIASSISLVVTVPYGIVADKFGRKIVLCLNLGSEIVFYLLIGIIGYFPTIFPTRAFILTAALQLIGGGGKVVSAIIYSIITDISTEEERTTLFYYLELVDYGTQLIIPAIVSLVMTFSIWVPFMAGVLVSAVSFLAALFLPETVKKEPRRPKAREDQIWEEDRLLTDPDGTQATTNGNSAATLHTESQPSEHYSATFPGTEERSRDSDHVESSKLRSRRELSPYVNRFPLKVLKGRIAPCIMLFIALALWSVAWTSHLFLQQYASQRFGISIAQSGLLMSYKALVNIVLFSLILPRVRATLIGKQSSNSSAGGFTTPRAKVDPMILRVSAFVLSCGSVWLSLANGKILYLLGITIVALGDGFNVTAQAIAITLADPSAVGQICSWFALVTTAGRAVGRPVMMMAFQTAADADDSSAAIMRGLPFAVAGILYASTFFILCVLPRLSPTGSIEVENQGVKDLVGHRQSEI